MKVQVIGSGSMWTINNSASYAVDDSILIDVPNGTCKSLIRQGIDLKTLNNILITHFHGDHYFDMPFFILLKKSVESLNLNIYCAKSGTKKIKKLFKLAFPHSFKKIFRIMNISFESKRSFSLNDKYNIERVLVDHGTLKPAYGYIIGVDNIKVGFTGDTTICDNLEYMMKKCDYIFGDCMLIKGTSKHMGVDFLENLMKKYPNCKYVVSHLNDDTRDYLKKANLNNVIIPKDGEIFEF